MDSFADAKAAAVHQDDDDFGLEIIDGIDESSDFLTGRNKGDILIELPEWKLIRIPGFVQDIESEKAKL
jgi:hypothetical protein